MGRIAVVTDSTADLPPDLAAAAGLRVVPLWVTFGDQEFRHGVDITTAEFWTRLLDPASAFPRTAAPSPGAFRDVFEACFADGAEAVVCPVIGSQLSGTFQAATLGAGMLPEREIHVIDTGTTSMGTGIAALLAAELAATGMAASDVAARVTSRLGDIDLFVAVDTLEYLRKNGRLSAARAAVGTILSVKPIITVRDGQVILAETPRTRNKARDRVIEFATAAPIERIAIMHTPTSPDEEVQAFRDRLVAAIPGGIAPDRVTVALIGASTGPHLGPNLMGAVFLRRS
jgi:DegV family protein with EDD domain